LVRLCATKRVEQVEKRTGARSYPVRGRGIPRRRVPPGGRSPVGRRVPACRWDPAGSRVAVVPPRTPFGVIPVSVVPPILAPANMVYRKAGRGRILLGGGPSGRSDRWKRERASETGAGRSQRQCATRCERSHCAASLHCVTLQRIPSVGHRYYKRDTTCYKFTVNEQSPTSALLKAISRQGRCRTVTKLSYTVIPPVAA
jgi:hypothetical protein